MTMPKFAIAATLAGALLCSAGSRKADASIQVDFQPSTGVTQAGFTGVSSNTTTLLPSGIKLTTTGLFFDRSPEDFEGTAQMAAVHVGFVYGLPLLVVGSIVLWFAGRLRRSTPADISTEPKVTP